MEYALSTIEFQLKKRLAYPYQWGRRQNDVWDAHTRFIYETVSWEELVAKMRETAVNCQFDKKELFQYAANRWYNYWHAVAVEQIFAQCPGVVRASNPKDPDKDFYLHTIPFDHKTTVFPKSFAGKYQALQRDSAPLLYWLYAQQSSQQRYHLKNRLFIVVYCNDGNHWKVKAEIDLLKRAVENYVGNFTRSQLQTLTFANDITALSDIIWVSR
ncbi:MAG: hypothetical protein CMC08_01410 [Flavobacteriaceae bacterium]|nr:hypothetical protein [Flavobacteriaceae bacterium]